MEEITKLMTKVFHQDSEPVVETVNPITINLSSE